MMTANKQGQPSDVIICKNNTPALIDCKVCENNIFTFDRIEENQWIAMTMWKKAGNHHALFALQINNDVRLIPYSIIKYFTEAGFKQFNLTQVMENSYSFEEWEVKCFAGNTQ